MVKLNTTLLYSLLDTTESGSMGIVFLSPILRLFALCPTGYSLRREMEYRYQCPPGRLLERFSQPESSMGMRGGPVYRVAAVDLERGNKAVEMVGRAYSQCRCHHENTRPTQ